MNPALDTFQGPGTSERIRVIVVGGGAAGLSALGALKRNPRVDVVLLEKSASIGGVWRAANYPKLATHIKSFVYRFYNFHAPKSATDYATRDEVLGYFNEYADAFDLRNKIALEHSVSRIVHSSGDEPARVLVQEPNVNELELSCDYVVCGLGFVNAGRPNLPELAGADEFAGTIVHSSAFSAEMLEDIRENDRRVCLLGAGKSAYDLAVLLQKEGLAENLVWAYRKFLWGLNHEAVYAGGAELLEKFALSGKYFNRMRRQPDDPQLIGLARQLRDSQLFLSLEKNFDFHQFRGAHYLADELESLRTIERRTTGIQALRDQTIDFEDGSSMTADYVICATGYHRGGHIPPIETTDGQSIDPRDHPLLYRSLIDPRIPRVILFTGEEVFPNQLYGFSICGEWLSRYVDAPCAPAELKRRLDEDEASLNGGVDERFTYTWMPQTDHRGHSFGRLEASARYRRQILTDLGIDEKLQTRLSISQFTNVEFEKANAEVAKVLASPAPKSDAMDNVEDAYGLTPLQEGMLFHTLSSPASGVYHEQLKLRVDYELEPGAFKQAWQRLHERHPILRTIFLWEDLDEPLQVVRRRVDLNWEEVDWRDDSDPGLRLQEYLEADRSNPLVLTEAPVGRFLLAREADRSWRFVWSLHHLLLDGWSLTRLLDELRQEYAAIRNGEASALEDVVPFGNYVAWLQDENLSGAQDFWRRELSGFDEPVDLRIHDPERGAGNQRCTRQLPGDLVSSLQDFCRQNRVTPNTLIHAAWAVLLSRLTDRSDVVFGTTVAGRPPALPGVERIVGCCINTLPLRVKLSEDDGLVAWLNELQQSHVRIRKFETTPLSAIQRWSDLPPKTELFQTLVVFESSPVGLSELATGDELTLSEVQLIDHSNYPLALLAIPTEEDWNLALVFDGQLYAAAAANRLLDQFVTTLASLIDPRTRSLADVRILQAAESKQLETWSDPPAATQEPDSVLTVIRQRTADRPGHPAVKYRNESLSYADLDRASNDLAARLSDLGVGSGDCVGLRVERSTQMIVGILGILKAGCAYVPLDPSYPEARLEFMLKDSGAKALVTREDETVEVHALPSEPDRPQQENLAYVIYTSGSTGRPKGVGVTHRNLAFSTQARFEYYQRPVDRFLLLSSFSFDSSIVGIFWTLCSGGTLVLPEEKLEQDIDALADLIAANRITHTLCLPSLYDVILRFAATDALDYLRVVILAGEACPPTVVQRHFETICECRLYNEYGPTEGTVWCTAAELTENASPTIGQPIPGAHVSVRDEKLRLLPVGVPGELCLGGPCLVPGYLNDAQSSDERFVPDPLAEDRTLYRSGDRVCWRSDGRLHFLGRVDEQLKIRGHRVEPGEIEAILREHESVNDAVVMLDQVSDDVDELEAHLANLNPEIADEILQSVS